MHAPSRRKTAAVVGLPLQDQPVGEIRPKSPVADVVIQFDSVEDFKRRPRYRGKLEIQSHEFGQILGKYELPEPKAAWATCGLNGCTRDHRFGYLITNSDGDETNCGHMCGERDFGVKFKEVVALLEKRFDEQARARVLVDLLSQRANLTERAQRLLPLVKEAAASMREFYQDFQSKDRFWAQLTAVARLGGDIRTSADAEAKGGTGRAAVALITIGRLEGSAVLLSSNVLAHERRILHSVLPWLKDVLGAPGVELQRQDALEGLLSDAGPMRQHLAEAEQFLIDSGKFLAPENLTQLELIRTHLMPSHGEQKALKRCVKRWAGPQG